MKKLLIAFLLCLLSTPAVSDTSTYLMGAAGKRAAAPEGCGGILTFVGTPGDTETFEYQEGDFCTTEFSETDPDGVISTYDTTRYHGDAHAVRFNYAGAGQNDNFIQVDIGSGEADFTLTWWVWLPDIRGWANFPSFSFTPATSISANMGCYISLLDSNNDANGKIQIYGTSADASVAVPDEAWYKLILNYTQNGTTTLEIYNTSNTLLDTLSVTATDQAVRYLNFGCILDDAQAEDYSIDDIQINTTD